MLFQKLYAYVYYGMYKMWIKENTVKMSNKTALQELIEDIEAYKEEAMTYHNIRELTALNYVLIKCSLLEEKEKQQIMEAWLNQRDLAFLNNEGNGFAAIEDLENYAEEYYVESYARK